MIDNKINRFLRLRYLVSVGLLLFVFLAGALFFVLQNKGGLLLADSMQVEVKKMTATDIDEQKLTNDVYGQQRYISNMRYLSHLVMRRDLFYPRVAAVVLYIDNKAYFSFKDYATMRDVIKSLNTYDSDGELIDIKLEQEIRFATESIPVSKFNGYDGVEHTLERIANGGIEVVPYTIVKGDTLSEIAANNNSTVERLIADNPQLKDKKYLTIGDTLVINRPEPLVTKFVTVLETRAEVLAPPEEYIDDANLYVGEKRLIKKGEPGKKLFTEKVTYRNGVSVERVVQSEEVVVEATSDVYQRGTCALPPQLAKSTLMRPVTAYRVTSRFGPRPLGYHYGIDLKVPYGTPVYAAEAGVVTTSGYRGARGKLIVIDHGNGLETYYEHNSELLVNVGQHVSKGQKICLSGNSGRSTGPHLHFEMKLNGVSVNPEKYLPF